MKADSDGAVRLYSINAFSSVATRALQVTVLVWVNQHLLRRLDPEEYSVFPLVLSLMYFGELFKNIVTSGLGRFIVEADSREDPIEVTRIVSSIFPVLLVVALALGGAGAIAAWQLDRLVNISDLYRPQAQVMLVLLVVVLGLNVLTAPFVVGGYVRQKFVALNLIDLATEAVRVVILLVLLLAISTKVVWLVVATTCATVVNILLRVSLTRQLLPAIRVAPGCFSVSTARRLLQFGAWTAMQGITGLVASTAPALLLNRFGTALDVASFHLGRLPEVQLRALIAVAAGPAEPALTRIYAMKGQGALHELYYRGGRYHLWISLLPVAPLVMFAPELILLYAGEQYSAAPLVIVALLGAYPFLWASAMFFRVAHAIGRVGAYYICDTVVQGATLAAMFYAVAVLDLGAPGAALAMGVAGAVLHIGLIWPMGLRLVEGKWRTFLVVTFLPGVLPFCAALLLAFTFQAFLPLNSWLQLGVGTLLVTGAYVAVLFCFCLDPVDRNLVHSALDRVRARLPRLQAG